MAKSGIFCTSSQCEAGYAGRDTNAARGRPQLLKVADKTVYTMSQKGQLPAFKVRGQWRFKRVDIDRWIERQKAESRNDGARFLSTPTDRDG